jgi:hypothetical protein
VIEAVAEIDQMGFLENSERITYQGRRSTFLCWLEFF